MKSKKFIISLIILYLLSFFITIFSEEHSYYEVSNDKKCTATAKRIAFEADIRAVSVIYKGKKLMCGILTQSHTLTEEELSAIKNLLKNNFPKMKKIRIESDNALASDILELSYYSSGKLRKNILSSRFDFLISTE